MQSSGKYANSKYKSPNCGTGFAWSMGAGQQANMPRLGQLVIICLGGRRRSLNKCVDLLGADDESRRRWMLVIVADCIWGRVLGWETSGNEIVWHGRWTAFAYYQQRCPVQCPAPLTNHKCIFIRLKRLYVNMCIACYEPRWLPVYCPWYSVQSSAG